MLPAMNSRQRQWRDCGWKNDVKGLKKRRKETRPGEKGGGLAGRARMLEERRGQKIAVAVRDPVTTVKKSSKGDRLQKDM